MGDLTRAERFALSRLARLHDQQPAMLGWLAMFLGTSAAATCRRSLVRAGLVRAFPGRGCFLYALTKSGQEAVAGFAKGGSS